MFVIFLLLMWSVTEQGINHMMHSTNNSGQYLEQYDTDDTGTISHIELTSMLNSLGSTVDNRSHHMTELTV